MTNWKWRSIKQERPDQGMIVAALDRYGNFHRAWMDCNGDFQGHGGEIVHFVTHWMPMPEVPTTSMTE